MAKLEQRIKDTFIKQVKDKEAEFHAKEEQLHKQYDDLIIPIKEEESKIAQELQELDEMFPEGASVSKDRKQKLSIK